MKARYSHLHKRVVWSNEPEWPEMLAHQETGGHADHQVHVTQARHFAETQLPRNYPYHKEAGGKFREDGTCVFDSWEQIERTVKVAADHGERICYDQPFRRIGGLD